MGSETDFCVFALMVVVVHSAPVTVLLFACHTQFGQLTPATEI